MTDVLEAVNAAFEALFYGNGSWFGLLLIASICLGLMLKWKYSGVFLMPIMGFIGIDYLYRNLAWQAMLIWFMIPVMLLYMLKQLK